MFCLKLNTPLRKVHASSNKKNVIIEKWAGHVARVEYRRGAYMVFVVRPEGNKPLARPRRRWKIILKWNFKNWDGGRLILD
jgi:hypothetical protein